MPTNYIKKISKEKGVPVADLEKKWSKAKAIAKDQGHGEDYAYIVGIFKKMAKVTSTITEENFIMDIKTKSGETIKIDEKLIKLNEVADEKMRDLGANSYCLELVARVASLTQELNRMKNSMERVKNDEEVSLPKLKGKMKKMINITDEFVDKMADLIIN